MNTAFSMEINEALGAVHKPSRLRALPDDVFEALKGIAVEGYAVGSRVTCNPAPTNTDEDYLVLTTEDPYRLMIEAGYGQEGSPQFYTGNDNGGFVSWRKGDINVIITQHRIFFDKFMTATHLAKRLNILDKNDRIALFQVILYDVLPHNLA